MSDPRFLERDFDKQLAHFIEECGEALQAAGKTLRRGRDAVNPYLPKEEQEKNEDWLIREVWDVQEAADRLLNLLADDGDLPLVTGRHHNEAHRALGEVMRHRKGPNGGYPEVGVVEVQQAHAALVSAYAERDNYKSQVARLRTKLATFRTVLQECRSQFLALPDGWGEAMPARLTPTLLEKDDA